MFDSKHFILDAVSPTDAEFHDILALRHAAYGHEAASNCDDIDQYSLHFRAKTNSGIAGALRVTCRRDGPLESEPAYPSWLFTEFGDTICAASRMCVHPHLKGRTDIPLLLTEAAWSKVLPMGIRIDISKARIDAIPFYMRQGYTFVRDSFFLFDKCDGWTAICGLIAFPAHPKVKSRLSFLFEDIASPCDLTQSPYDHMFVREYREYATLLNTFRRDQREEAS